jgi:hypothetical protein
VWQHSEHWPWRDIGAAGVRGPNGYQPGSEIPISSEDAKRCIDLVQACCSEICENYMTKARPHLEETARQQDEWKI